MMMTQLPELSLDRCHRCGDDASVKVEFASGCELFLCGSHARHTAVIGLVESRALAS